MAEKKSVTLKPRLDELLDYYESKTFKGDPPKRVPCFESWQVIKESLHIEPDADGKLFYRGYELYTARS